MRKISWSSLLIRSGRKTRVAGRVLSLLALVAFVFTAKYYASAFYTWFVAPARHHLQTWAENRLPLQVHYLDVGQGDSILVQCQGCNLLIDGGSEWAAPKIIADLEERGVKHLDAIVCTHDHEDHFGGLLEVYRKYGADNVYASPYLCNKYEMLNSDIISDVEDNCVESGDVSVQAFNGVQKKDLSYLLKELKMHNQSLVPLKVGDELSLGEAKFKVLGPVEYFPSEKDNVKNNHSLVLRLTYGKRSFLFPGDIQKEQERALVRHYGSALKSDVLKVAHHGSGSSSTQRFIRAVRPKCSVISVGVENDYGLPHDNIVKLLHSYSDRVYRTDKHGTITVHSDGSRLTYSTERWSK